jgi:hypothetical protein
MNTASVGTPDRSTARRRLWTPDELADYLGVTLHCIYAWSSRGDGPKVLTSAVGCVTGRTMSRRGSTASPTSGRR